MSMENFPLRWKRCAGSRLDPGADFLIRERSVPWPHSPGLLANRLEIKALCEDTSARSSAMPGSKVAVVATMSRDPVAMHIVSRDQPAVNVVGRDEDFSTGRMGVCADGGKDCHKCEAGQRAKNNVFICISPVCFELALISRILILL